MTDFNRLARKEGNKIIVNQDIITNPDRNIDDVVITCYSNMRSVKLAAYDLDYAGFETEFSCFFKAQLDKIAAIHKNNIKQREEMSNMEMNKVALNIHGTSMTIDVKSLKNNFKILKMKYFLDPVNIIQPKYILHAVTKTLEEYNNHTMNYSNKVDDSYNYLVNLKKEYTRLNNTGEVKANLIPDSKNMMDLFIKEQMVLLPVYHDDGKYTIDGIKYYGVFNNRTNDVGVITKSGDYGFKVFKDSSIYTTYMTINNDVIIVSHYKDKHNLFHLMTQKNALDTPMNEVFPETNDEYLKYLFERTYQHAQALERGDTSEFNIKGINVTIPDPTKDKNGRANLGDDIYKKKLISSLKEFLALRDKPQLSLKKTRRYEFLGALEEEIYMEINRGSISKNSDLESAKKRINISPLSIITIIKRGSGKINKTLMFTSTSTEPNPFDIFYLFGFMKTTQHTNTKNGKAGGTKPPEEEKWLKWTDAEYIAEFAPKSEENIGKSTNLKFSIPSEFIIKRKNISGGDE